MLCSRRWCLSSRVPALWHLSCLCRQAGLQPHGFCCRWPCFLGSRLSFSAMSQSRVPGMFLENIVRMQLCAAPFFHPGSPLPLELCSALLLPCPKSGCRWRDGRKVSWIPDCPSLLWAAARHQLLGVWALPRWRISPQHLWAGTLLFAVERAPSTAQADSTAPLVWRKRRPTNHALYNLIPSPCPRPRPVLAF